MPRRKGKRRAKRTLAVVPVQLWITGSENVHLAHTLNITNHGVQLGGYRGDLKTGDVLTIKYRHKRAQFRVTWIVALGPSEKRIGAECLEPEKNLWGEQFPQQADEYEI